MKIHIADGFAMPIEAVTQTFAILAKRGAGKTYTARVMAEEMLRARQQIVALDPTGAWWGLRSAFPVAVLGGEHGDLPLEETAGEVLAAAIVENRLSAIVDLSLQRKGQMIRFMVAFAETIYRLNRDPVHLFVDEADAFAPQGRTFGGEENRMLGAMEDLVRRGRKRGIGCTLITQRPAVLNKNVLTQCESLFALRMVHPKDIDAIEEWIRVNADPAQAKEVIDSLPSLPIGEAWFWSPGWLGQLKRLRIRKLETFDSGATPKPGERIKAPGSLAEIDLDQLGAKIKETAQKAKDNDPRELRKRIAELERRVRQPAAQPLAAEVIEVPVLANGQLERLDKVLTKFDDILVKHRQAADQLVQRLHGEVATIVEAVTMAQPRGAARAQESVPARRPAPAPAWRSDGERTEDASDVGRGGLRRMLISLAQRPPALSAEQLGVRSGLSSKSGTFDTYLARARKAGWIVGDRSRLAITADGLSALGKFEPLPTGAALLDYWLGELGQSGASRMLRALADVYPRELSRSELAERAGLTGNSGTFDTYLARLRRLELVEGKSELRASAELFE